MTKAELIAENESLRKQLAIYQSISEVGEQIQDEKKLFVDDKGHTHVEYSIKAPTISDYKRRLNERNQDTR